MTKTEERRADGFQRVPVEAMVEVCGVAGKEAPFEAESADVSGRGIRLRTAYLPEDGAPVVCRFENAGREVLAEGVVAWCRKETRGGEFGVRFTALDARSAETLRELCGIAEDGTVASPPTSPEEALEPQKVTPGAKVKLHIEGLGAPMRARIDAGKGTHISVGSSLEFLRIGRKLEMESIEDGSRREARIDGLDVMIDPTSGVPRLLVRLKTDGDENTPQPSVVDASRRSGRALDAAASAQRAAAKSVRESPDPPSVTREEDPTEEQIDAMVGRVRRMAGVTRRKVSEVSIQIGARLGPSVGRAFETVRQLSRRPTEPPRRRTTSAPANHPTTIERNLRPQNRVVPPQGEVPESRSTFHSPRVRRAASGVVAAGLLATVIAVAMRNPETAKAEGATADPLSPDQSALTSSATGSLSPAGNGANATGTLASPGQSQASPEATAGNGIVAQVPLFGTTTLATLEPAPVASAESAADVAAREQALAKAAQAAMASGVNASQLSEEPTPEADEATEEPKTKPEDVAPFGRGRMKDPILYRLKLDAPGEALKGTSSSKGFSVVVPGRKMLESPRGFVKRDERFQKISSSHSSEGVKLTWLFKEDAPAYRVRLRKSAIEILISETVKSTKSSKKD